MLQKEFAMCKNSNKRRQKKFTFHEFFFAQKSFFEFLFVCFHIINPNIYKEFERIFNATERIYDA